MSGDARIVVFGATGVTGRLVAEALVRRGARPVLAGRDAAKLEALGAELGGGLEVRIANVDDRATLGALVAPGDVLVSTVGPFMRFGDAVAQAAIEAGAHYLDSTGEPPFVRRVFERYGPDAERAGTLMLSAFGYDYVPGNLAAALAMYEAGQAAVRVDTGYFLTRVGSERRRRLALALPSGGTRASLAGVLPERGFAWRGGRLVEERVARRVRHFEALGRRRSGISIGASEHLALPRSFPRLLEVNVYLGWFDPLSRVAQAASLAGAGALRLPGARRLVERAGRAAQSSGNDPDPEERGRWRSLVFGTAHDGDGSELARVVLEGPDPYTFTGDLLAWGALRVAAGIDASGARGPVEAFGAAALGTGCAEAGLHAAGAGVAPEREAVTA